MIRTIKDHPGVVMLFLALAVGEYCSFMISSDEKFAFSFLMGMLFVFVTMWPSIFIVCLLWAILGWWRNEDGEACEVHPSVIHRGVCDSCDER